MEMGVGLWLNNMKKLRPLCVLNTILPKALGKIWIGTAATTQSEPLTKVSTTPCGSAREGLYYIHQPWYNSLLDPTILLIK